jgi:hypothetical protein
MAREWIQSLGGAETVRRWRSVADDDGQVGLPCLAGLAGLNPVLQLESGSGKGSWALGWPRSGAGVPHGAGGKCWSGWASSGKSEDSTHGRFYL